ncbi:MAG TPA: hypothetical protein VN030_01695 [Cellvibrio sp.]|nr:hypothetical protein [Cellvibrio sp.]
MFESYRKLNMHFDEMISIMLGLSLIFLIVNGLVQSFVLTQKGWDSSTKSTLILAGILTFLFFLFCFYGYSYGKEDSQLANPRIYLLPLVLFIFTSLASVGFNYGINIFLGFGKTGVVYSTGLVIWCCIYLGIPLSLTGLYYSQLYKSQLATSQKVLLPLTLVKNDAMPIYIKEMKFIDSANREEVSVNVDLLAIDAWQNNEADETLYNKLTAQNNEFFSVNVLIPKGTDSFLLSWYSYTDQKIYTDLFPMDLQKFNLKTDYYAHNQESLLIASMKPPRASSSILRFKHNGDIDLLTYLHGERYLVYYYTQINSEPITEAHRAEIEERHGHSNYEEIIKNLPHLNALLENAAQAESRKFNWKITVDWDQKELDHFRFTQMNYEYLAIADEAVTLFKQRLLPLEISFYARNEQQSFEKSLHLSLDGIKLFEQLKALPDNEEITFNIKVNDENNRVELYIISKSLNILFSDFTQNMVNYNQ